jgi:hypothetical protein
MISIERQIENGLATALAGISGVNIYKSDTEGQRLLPNLVIQASIGSEEVIPYSGVFRCPATITYVTRADTTTRSTFDAKFQEILQVMYQSPNLASVLTTATLKVFLANVTSESPEIKSENRTWSKSLSLDISCTTMFSPAKLSGLSLWLKADAGVTLSGSNVTAWADQSGNGNNAIGSGTLPTLQSNAINGYPAIRLNNTGSNTSRFTVSNNFNLKNSSVFIVVKQLNLGNPFARMLSFLGSNDDYNSNDGLAFLFNNIVPQLQVESNSNNAVIENLVANNVFALASYKIDNSGNISVFYNGASEGTGQNANMTSQNSGGAIYIGLGSQNVTAAGLYGDIAEVILYNSNLSTPQRQQVEAYLNAKYAIY